MRKLGWIRDLADIRDYHPETESVSELMCKSPRFMERKIEEATSSDLRPWMPPVANQGDIGSCTAHAGAAVMEYYENRAFQHYVKVSRLFLYKATRNIAHLKGDTGAELRNVMQVLATLGVPDEQYWPYDEAKFDVEPTAFHYAMAESYKATQYFRHDPGGSSAYAVLASLKKNLLAGIPSMFGTTVHASFPGLGARDDGSGRIPFPSSHDSVQGGHAMVIVGHDDAAKSFLVRNSWGEDWGLKGYGWLPYQFLTSGLATDFWSILHAEFVDSALFA